jgi:hypothetical protein
MTEKIAIRGLAHMASRIFFVWGGLVFLKGLWDLTVGQPEANAFSSRPWEFVTRAEWLRYALFETVYGLTCVAAAWAIRAFAARLPQWRERKKKEEFI